MGKNMATKVEGLSKKKPNYELFEDRGKGGEGQAQRKSGRKKMNRGRCDLQKRSVRGGSKTTSTIFRD